MFLDFYQLQEQPFGVTPDPRYLYLSASHREALASLFCGIKTGRGLLALVAPPGMGKTTLLFRLLEHLRRSARTVFLFQTQCDSAGLLRYLLTDLGIDGRELDFVSMHEQLNEVLLREKSAGRRFVLVIDEAQNLDNSVLETARLLSDFETPSEKLLQIVLAGQEQLAEKLQKPELAQLRQRIAILGRLDPLTASEVGDYIGTRLMVAGYRAGRLFTPAALNRIAETSQGIPRNINNVCFNAMSLGCALGRKQIEIDLVDQAAADLDISAVGAKPRREPPVVVQSVPAKPGAPARVPGVPVSIFGAAERKSRFKNVPVFASVIVLALLAAVLYRKDTKIAVAQTRKTLVVAAASLSSHRTAAKAEPAAATMASRQPSAEQPLTLTNRDSAIAATHTGASDLGADEQRPRTVVTAHQQPTSLQVEFAGGTTIVIVQPHDDLRQICLHYFGSYSTRLVSKISKLNPELADPNRIAIGQRIILPGSANVGANVSSSLVSRP